MLDKVWFVGHNLRIRYLDVVIHPIIQLQTTKRPIKQATHRGLHSVYIELRLRLIAQHFEKGN